MKSLAIVLALFTFPVEASELYAFYFCGKPAMYVGVTGISTLPATPFDINQSSSITRFFERVVRDLPIEDGKRVVHEFHIDRLLDHNCGVSA